MLPSAESDTFEISHRALAWRAETANFQAFPALRQEELSRGDPRRTNNSASPWGVDCAAIEAAIEATEASYRHRWRSFVCLPLSRHPITASWQPAGVLARLAVEQIPLTVCPLSNVNLGVFARLEEHNIARLLRRGIAVSLHSDDPPYFGGYLSHCFEQTAAALDLSATEVTELNKNAIRAAFLDRETKQRLLAASDAALASGFKQVTVPGS